MTNWEFHKAMSVNELEVAEFNRKLVELATMEQGGRNNQLNKLAYIAGTLVSRNIIQEHWAIEQLLVASNDNGHITDDGMESIEQTILSGLEAGESVKPEDSNPIAKKILSVKDLANLPPLEWLIEGVVQKQSLMFIVGDAGVGKSFVTMDICASLSNKDSWNDREIKNNGSTIYVAAEGSSGLYSRMSAWEKYHKQTVDKVKFIPFPVIYNGKWFARLHQYAIDTKPAVIVFDTLARTALGVEENNATEMGVVVEAFDEIKRDSGATIIILHHITKSNGQYKGGTMRGSGTLKGAADTVIKINEYSQDQIELYVEKQKEHSGGALGIFTKQYVDDSCVWVSDKPTNSINPWGK